MARQGALGRSVSAGLLPPRKAHEELSLIVGLKVRASTSVEGEEHAFERERP